MASENCIFCKIINNQLPSTQVFENENVLAFKDIHPTHETHYLFIPKKHYSRLDQIPDSEISVMADLYQAINSVAKKEGLDQAGFKTVIHVGEGGGQVVFHLHIHLISGRKLK